MLFKLIALGLVAANPTPLAFQTSGNRWFKLGRIDGTNPTEINKIIHQEWGLTIDDFKLTKDRSWYEHDGEWYDAAFSINLDEIHWFTVFYQRNHY